MLLVLLLALFITAGNLAHPQSVMVTPPPPGWAREHLDQVNDALDKLGEHPFVKTLDKALRDLFEITSSDHPRHPTLPRPDPFGATLRLIAAVEKSIDPNHDFDGYKPMPKQR